MNEDDKMIIPLRVPKELGRQWKMEAVKKDQSVQRWILDRLVDCEQGASTYGDAQRGVAKARSENVKVTLDVTSESKSPAASPQPVVKSQSIGGVPVGPLVARLPVGESEVTKMKCAGCSESVTQWTVAKNGKPYCQDCVDNQRNGQ